MPSRARRTSTDGFTLIELLVVIAIIGILSAIAVPSYLRHRSKGYRAAATEDMKNAATAIETFATDHDGQYTLLDGADQDSPELAAEGYNRSAWISMVVHADGSSYCIRGLHGRFPDHVFVFRSATGVVAFQTVLEATDCA